MFWSNHHCGIKWVRILICFRHALRISILLQQWRIWLFGGRDNHHFCESEQAGSELSLQKCTDKLFDKRYRRYNCMGRSRGLRTGCTGTTMIDVLASLTRLFGGCDRMRNTKYSLITIDQIRLLVIRVWPNGHSLDIVLWWSNITQRNRT